MPTSIRRSPGIRPTRLSKRLFMDNAASRFCSAVSPRTFHMTMCFIICVLILREAGLLPAEVDERRGSGAPRRGAPTNLETTISGLARCRSLLGSSECLLPRRLLDEFVDRHRQHQQHPGDDQADLVFHAHQVKAILHGADYERTQEGRMYRATSAEQAHA